MKTIRWTSTVAGLGVAFALGWLLAGKSAQGGGEETPAAKGWTKGKGWAPRDADDEVGALNAMTSASMKAALGLVKQGKVYDLGVPYDAESYKWPGHNPGAIMTYRGPEGVRRQGDFKAAADPKLNPAKIGWHSCALFISDNVATQIDGLGHITEGDDNHWYNGFKEADWGGNFPPSSRAASCSTSPGFASSTPCPRTIASAPRSCKPSPRRKKPSFAPATPS